MANDVYSKIICKEETIRKYFVNDEPFGDGQYFDPPYITFNHLFGIHSLYEDESKTGILQ